MIQIAVGTRIFVGTSPLDFRCSFNGTAATCRLKLGQDPLSGALFVFVNRSRTMIRFYLFDGHGEWVATKRVATGRFLWWKDSISDNITAEHLYLLLRGGDPQKIKIPEPWKRIR